MRILLSIVLAFVSTAGFADSTGERRPAGRTPTATETISDLYSFSRFQQGLLESTDLKGNAEVKNLAALRAEEAARRDKALKEIQEAIGTEPRVPKTTPGEREPGRARNLGRTDFRQKLLCRANSRV